MNVLEYGIEKLNRKKLYRNKFFVLCLVAMNLQKISYRVGLKISDYLEMIVKINWRLLSLK